MQVCHGDLKPENILIILRTLKLADFGCSAKLMGRGPSSNHKFGTRWFQAPEILLGSSEYGTSMDWWSCGCVIAEMMRGRPLFAGPSNWVQICAIMQVLGTPSTEDIKAMRPRHGPILELLMYAGPRPYMASPLHVLLPEYALVPDALLLPQQLLMYSPSARLHPAKALCSALFTSLPEDSDGHLPVHLFDFTGPELSTLPVASQEALPGFVLRRNEQKASEVRLCTPTTEGCALPAPRKYGADMEDDPEHELQLFLSGRTEDDAKAAEEAAAAKAEEEARALAVSRPRWATIDSWDEGPFPWEDQDDEPPTRS